MLDPGAVLGFAQKALHGDRVLRQARPQDLHRGPAALGVLGAIHGGRAALADVLGEVVARHRPSHHVVGVHGSAKLPRIGPASKLDRCRPRCLTRLVRRP